MYHFMEFDPYLIGERNLQILREVRALRLEERLRKDHEGSGSPLAAFFILRLKSTLHLLRGAGLAGRLLGAQSTAGQRIAEAAGMRDSSERNTSDRVL